jgi:hypothetical protein
MEGNNGFLMMIGGGFAVFMQWVFMDVHWAMDGVFKTIMSLFYGGVGACGAYFTRKYIIVHVEKHEGFMKWMKAIWKKRKGSDDAEPPKQ